MNISSNNNNNNNNNDYAEIQCCKCGLLIRPNSLNMCKQCTSLEIDITVGISKQITLFQCSSCGRYLRSTTWMAVELESRELLALCLKKIKGINKNVKLIDAEFIWTEPHSRRIKIKITIQKEVYGAIIQQSFIVIFIVTKQQCSDCQKSFTEHTWTAVVQVRQRVKHKRTFLFLEQLLIKHNVCEKVLSIKQMTDGLDFFWASKGGATHLLDFLRSVVPIKTKTAKKLISQDFSSNITKYKHTIFVEIVPICKGDLVILPKKLAKSKGGITPLLLCLRVTKSIRLMDPITLTIVDISANEFWREPFKPVLSSREMKRFMVLDIIKDYKVLSKLQKDKRNSKMSKCEVEVMLDQDIGNEDGSIFTKSHLGNILKPGDMCVGFDLRNVNFTKSMLSGLKLKELPYLILVKKVYPRENRNYRRKWKLKNLAMEKIELKSKHDKQVEKADEQQFLDDIEEDEDMRKNIQLVKKGDNEIKEIQKFEQLNKVDEQDDVDVPLTELMEQLTISKNSDKDDQKELEDFAFDFSAKLEM